VDLTAWLVRRTPIRPFVVATPGGTSTRLAVERFAREHGWRAASSPAEANLLVVAGPDAAALDPFVDRAWDGFPAPRARTHVRHPADAPAALHTAAASVRDPAVQRREAEHAAHVQRSSESQHPPSLSSCGAAMPADEHSAHQDHRDEDGHETGHGAHHGHDMSGMEMPGGIPMADRGPDRDGLMLDQLHVPLGPALSDWPAGLIVHAVLQGDVVQQAEVELLDLPPLRELPPPLLVHRLDCCARLLSAAGWSDMAARARRLRDDVTDRPMPELAPRVRRWAAGVRRSRTLRWSLAGVGESSTGDAVTRLHRWLADIVAIVDGDDWEDVTPQPGVDTLADLLVGTELATARLVVASLDLDLWAGTAGSDG
jgi:hypothetical protein